MIKINKIRICLLMTVLLLAFTTVFAAEKENIKEQLDLADDITREVIVGPGSIQVTTEKNILMSFGALVRIIPTSESNYDFGLSDIADQGFLYGSLGSNFFKDHANEGGWVNNNYIRNENKLYFNALPRDRKWSFYAALEYDDVWENSSVDNRGGKTSQYSNFGLERLHGTILVPNDFRLHLGFDVWGLDTSDGGALVYGDDNPGFWVTRSTDRYDFNVGYFKLAENDYQTGPAMLNDDRDDDRDLFAGYLTWKINQANTLKFIYAYDRIMDTPVNDLLGALTESAMGISTGQMAETDSHHIGAYYIGTLNNFEFFCEGVYQFGSSDNTGLSTIGKSEDYDISAYALAADVSFQAKGLLTGFPFKPHLGIIYTSGDSDPDDDKLEGYNGVANAQRFSPRWGGENTIIGDHNWVLGTPIYSYVPEMYGNGTPVATGGVQNFSGMGIGRGDNPGLTMVSAGFTTAPKPYIIFKTNVNMFYWNEDFEVPNYVNPAAGYTRVDSGYVGTEWDNELTFVFSKNTFIKGQASVFFPGDVIRDVTKAMTGGQESDEKAYRIGAEFIWKF